MRIKHLISIIIITSLIVCLSCDGPDDDEPGVITGYIYVTDTNAQARFALDALPLESASVSIDSLGVSDTSGEDGDYTLEDVPAGTYTVKCSLDGYQTTSVQAVVIKGRTTSLNITIEAVDDGRTFYISEVGDDYGSGTITHPWKTGYNVQYIEPGDTVIVQMGNIEIGDLSDEGFRPPSGKPGKWITIKGDSDISALEGCDNVSAVIDISNSSYVRIENLEITPYISPWTSTMRDGISGLGANLKYVILKDLRINYLNEFGINIGDVNYITIDNCRISYCGFGAIGGPDGFGIEESDGPIEIYDTRAEHNKGDGLDSKARNTYIHHCIVANNSCDGVKLWGGGSKIENTLIYGTGDGVGGSSPWAGIVIGTTEQDAEFEIINVTIQDNPEREAYPIYVQYDEDVPINVLLRNTIIAGGYGHIYFKDVVDLTADYNLFYMPGRDDQIFANGRTYGINELTQLGVGNVFANPLFVSAAWGAVGNYKVLTGSSAIDTGISNGAPSDDLEHTSRPQGQGYDKGSYEQ